jgi:hypothetical protein
LAEAMTKEKNNKKPTNKSYFNNTADEEKQLTIVIHKNTKKTKEKT